MRRLPWFLSGLVTILALPAIPAGAGGGGGCRQPVTSSTGSVVEMRNVCFSPTVLRVRPGTTVTFVNRDDFPHNVIGANDRWGRWEELALGDSVTRTFKEPGVFPYACAFHPGMMGSVVVGRGVVVETVFLPPAPEPVETPSEGATTALIVPDPPMRISSFDAAAAPGWRPTALVPWALALVGIGYGIIQRRRARRA